VKKWSPLFRSPARSKLLAWITVHDFGLNQNHRDPVGWKVDGEVQDEFFSFMQKTFV
jgi:hypothetical protein